jgi:hypothetical protein
MRGLLLLLLGAILWSPGAFAQDAAHSPPGSGSYHRLMAIAYVGTQSFTGEIRQAEEGVYPDPGPGVRLGGLVGIRPFSIVSLNGEVSIDWLNLDPLMYGGSARGLRASLSLAPLYHVPLDAPLQLVAGPKVGVWRQTFRNSRSDDEERGYLWGLNLAGFVPVGRTLLGALFSFENAVRTEECFVTCSPMSGTTPEGILTFNVAAMY